MKTLLEAVNYMHKVGFMHRDLKPSNILIDKDFTIKITDFGLTRETRDFYGKYTNNVITIWYRPLEIIFGDENYSTAVDMWSLGCIFAEIMTKKPIFQGMNDFEQVEKITSVCGTPSQDIFGKLGKWNMFQFKQKLENRIDEIFCEFPENCVKLLKGLLELDPNKRLTAEEALKMEWFHVKPFPDVKKGKSLPLNRKSEMNYKLEQKELRKRVLEEQNRTSKKPKRDHLLK